MRAPTNASVPTHPCEENIRAWCGVTPKVTTPTDQKLASRTHP
uniref:Uncharacterized protein n=1 Tax=Arundo donax TaxID=35708 RepID=A0A0A9DH85_ARUDO